MDLLERIRQKANAISKDDSFNGVKAAIKHIEVAEKYLQRAVEENEDDLFNDVIYRTNQAFEGILKEAYCILTIHDAEKKSPYQIEQYFLKEHVFTQRVSDLFANYRQNWRNPSTHDHKLFFGEQEAFLAIISVLAFMNILLDQIIESVNFKKEQLATKNHVYDIRQAVGDYESLPFGQQLVSLLLEFKSYQAPTKLKGISEAEIIGQIGGYIHSVDPLIMDSRQMIISKGNLYRPDLIFAKGDEKIIVEIKRGLPDREKVQSAYNQMLRYLEVSRLDHGIIFFPAFSPQFEMTVNRHYSDIENRKIAIDIIRPVL